MGKQQRLKRCGENLEGGIIIPTYGSEYQDNCLSIPAGCLHSVFTYNGGFLGGFNYSSAEDLVLASKMISSQLPRLQVQDQLMEDIHWYLLTLEEALEANDFKIIPRAFYSLVELLKAVDLYPDRNDTISKKVKGKAEKAWRKWRAMNAIGKYCKCVCGTVFEDFKEHFTVENCGCLTPDSGLP